MQAVFPITNNENVVDDTDSESDAVTNNGSDEGGSDEEISACTDLLTD